MPYKFKLGDQAEKLSAEAENAVGKFIKKMQVIIERVLKEDSLNKLPSCKKDQIAAVLSCSPKGDALPAITPAGMCLLTLPHGINLASAIPNPDILFHTSNGRGVFLPLTSNLASGLNLALKALEEIGVKLTLCPYSAVNMTIGPYNDNPRALLVHKLTDGCTPGASGCHYDMYLSSTEDGAKRHINFVGVRESDNIVEIATTFMHEIGHALGFQHILPMGTGYPNCFLEYLEHAKAMENMLTRYRCLIDTNEPRGLTTVMTCVSDSRSYGTKFQMSEADKIAFYRRYLYLTTGDKQYLYPLASTPARSGSSRHKDGDLFMHFNSSSSVCSIEPNKTCHTIKEPEQQLRRRRTSHQNTSEMPISMQPDYREIVDASLDAFIVSFTIGVLNELVKYQTYINIDRKSQEKLIHFAVTSIYFGLPVAVFTESTVYAMDYLKKYLGQKDVEKYQLLVRYLAPVLPLLIEIFATYYRTRQLINLIKIPAVLASGYLGKWFGSITYHAWRTMLAPTPKQKTD